MEEDVKKTMVVASMRGLIAFAESIIETVTEKSRGRTVSVNAKANRSLRKKKVSNPGRLSVSKRK